MKARFAGSVAILLFAGSSQTALGQKATSSPHDAIPVVSVCEALKDLARFNGMSIVVVGRFGYTDEGTWLSEDCEHKVVTDGYTWANIISTTIARSEADPPPSLPKKFRWDDQLLAAKLREVQKTTKLRILKQDHYSDKWVAIFGRFETRQPLRVATGGGGKTMGYGFGHLNAAPAQLISSERGFRELKAEPGLHLEPER